MAMIGDGMAAAKIAGELGDVILGKIPGRAVERDVVFESVGMALWDTVAAAWATLGYAQGVVRISLE